MQTALEPGDRKLLILAVLLISALSAVALFFSPGRVEGTPGIPSSYSASSTGAKAAYLELSELGYDVERWLRPPEELPGLAEPQGAPDAPGPSANNVLVLVDPIIPPSTDERSSLRDFIRRGGQVLTTGYEARMLIPDLKLDIPKQAGFAEQTFRAEVPSPLTRGASEISMRAFARWSAHSGYHVRYYGDEGGATVAVYSLGKGRVIWWAESGPLTNYGLTQASNLQLFLNSVGEPGKTRILWDEYYHGQRVGFWAYLGHTPIPWAIAQMGLLFAAAFFSFGRRSGPVRALRTESRLSPLEFVETLGDLYQRKGGASEALGIAYQRYRFVLLKRLGLAPSATPQDIQRGVRERLGWSIPGFSETLQRCELGVKDRSLTGARSLLLIQELHDYARRFRLGKSEIRN